METAGVFLIVLLCLCSTNTGLEWQCINRHFDDQIAALQTRLAACEEANQTHEGVPTFLPAEVTWAVAERTCLSLGGNLASIHSEAEHTFVKDLIRNKTGGLPRAWIGGYDVEGQNAAWMWSDGSPMNFTAWAPAEPGGWGQQPDNLGGNQHCMTMNFGASDLWDDEQCSTIFPSVCKIPE